MLDVRLFLKNIPLYETNKLMHFLKLLPISLPVIIYLINLRNVLISISSIEYNFIFILIVTKQF